MNLKNARELRKNATDCERLLWLHLRAGRLQGFKFKRQQPLGNYIVDFVCFQTRLIVEADGGQHNEQIEYDTRRDNWLRSQGFNVLRFWNNDILANTEAVLATILKACMDYVDTPSPQPLSATVPDVALPPASMQSSHEGRGAKAAGFISENRKKQNAPDSNSTATNTTPNNPDSPPPSRGRGRGRGEDGL